jgi:ribonucleoside-diphosphate reductase alpha chain
VKKEYGVPMSDISITEEYERMVDNPNIRKTKINARKLFQNHCGNPV